jgi:hypothetical protein
MSQQHFFTYTIPIEEKKEKLNPRQAEFYKITSKEHSKKNMIEWKVSHSLPLHFRYQPIQPKDEYTNITTINPIIFLQCKIAKNSTYFHPMEDWMKYFRGKSTLRRFNLAINLLLELLHEDPLETHDFYFENYYLSHSGETNRNIHKMPNGIEEDFTFVGIGTFSCTIIIAILIVYLSLFKINQINSKLKKNE